MAKENSNFTCFVVQAPQDKRFEQLYNELFRIAIAEAQLAPRLMNLSSGQPPSMKDIADQVGAATACFADITQDSPYVWFAIGCATALGKPLCVISSADPSTLLASLPGTIFYPIHPLPSDYQRLQEGITSQLLLAAPDNPKTPHPAHPIAEDSRPGPLNAASTVEASTPVEEETPLQLAVGDIRVHELLALSIIHHQQSPNGMALRQLALEMNKHGLAQATSLSINGLCRKKLVERKMTPINDGANSYDQDSLFLTSAGSAWIEANHDSLDLSLTAPPANVEPTGLMEYIASI
jgi:hypothetical protein